MCLCNRASLFSTIVSVCLTEANPMAVSNDCLLLIPIAGFGLQAQQMWWKLDGSYFGTRQALDVMLLHRTKDAGTLIQMKILTTLALTQNCRFICIALGSKQWIESVCHLFLGRAFLHV
jgi:hypothetical protein